MSWIYYLLEANLYLSVFYVFYRLVLHKETFYAANRFYLLISSVLAFTLPFLQIGFLLKPALQYQQIAYNQVEESPILTLENGLLLIYGIGAACLLLRLLVGFKHIIAMLAKADVKLENGLKVIELSNTKTAFSFFNLLFIDPSLPQKNIVVKHEMVHINQKHSIDVLLLEFVQIISWFNPLIYLLKKDIKLLHEYLADEATTKNEIAKYEYAMFLIQNTYDSQNLSLTNQIFNSSILKQRITMLNQKKSAKWARLRLLVAMPLVGAMLCTSTMAFTKDYGILDLYPKSNLGNFSPKQTTPKKAKAKEIVIEEPTRQVPPPPPIEKPRNKKLYGKKNGQNPPPPPKAPATKSLDIKIAPPPPPVEPKAPKAAKGEVLEIRLAPPPPIEPKPAKKG
ncbi:M56 family metallopeptidase [Pedobacter sp. Leaf132]|uniref:M56 family metallopeptidase n=1 Tax=Pedobacter sp. Leaf132 TaxID=2876557 RepID=UPI001E29D585|nr:M56 family metallopeptidase [Pedobacter sp. Leaf132]